MLLQKAGKLGGGFKYVFLSFFYLYLHLGEMIQLDLHNIFQLGWNSTQAPFLGNHQATGYHGCCWWFQVAQPGYWDALYVGVLIGSLGEVFGGSEPCTWKTWLVLGVKLRVKLTATCLKEADVRKIIIFQIRACLGRGWHMWSFSGGYVIFFLNPYLHLKGSSLNKRCFRYVVVFDWVIIWDPY